MSVKSEQNQETNPIVYSLFFSPDLFSLLLAYNKNTSNYTKYNPLKL